MPAIQSKDLITSLEAGVPKTRARVAFTVAVTGVLLAKAWSQEGMVSIGTKIELIKANGNSQIKPATWAVSTFLTVNPMAAETQEKA